MLWVAGCGCESHGLTNVFGLCISQKVNILLAYSPFTGYGKAFLKQHRLHPDSYIQMVLQLVYYKMHSE